MNNQPEILAPCGDEQSFYAAVNAGADAVYLGLKSFSARAKAENFSKENISRFVDYAHLFGVKVYVTVNTLVKDDERNDFLDNFEACVKANVDAYIIQDFGIATLIRKYFPSAVLHASTQTGINNVYAAKVFKDLGFKRVVLSRETSLKDLKEICKLGIETEFFVQGALCVSYSGNCYLSSVKCGDSGNRGLCRQLCRLDYASGQKSGHLLSPKDLCLATNVGLLSEAGVTSLKIEGRLKRPSYVAQSVKTLRTALYSNDVDRLKRHVSTLKKISSRGEYNTSAYLFSRDNIIDTVNHNYKGEFFGTISSIENIGRVNKVGVKTFLNLSEGDGLMTGGITMGVGNVEKSRDGYYFFTVKNGFSVGDEVFRTFDKVFEDGLIPEKRLIAIDCAINAFSQKPFELTLKANGKSFTVVGEVLQKADNRPLTESEAKQNIKFDGLPFYLDKFSFESDGVFIRKSAFNELRRQAVDGIKRTLADGDNSDLPPVLTATLRQQFVSQNSSHITLPACNYYILNENSIDSFDFSLMKGTDKIVFSPSFYSAKTIENALKKCRLSTYSGTFYINLPIIANGDEVAELIKIADKIHGSDKNCGVVVNNYYGFYFLNKVKCIAGTGLNVYSRLTASVLSKAGFEDCFSSIERTDCGGKIYSGNPPLMTMVHCPYKVAANSSCQNCTYDGKLTYTDAKNNRYVISRYKIDNCYFELRFADNTEYDELVKNRGEFKVFDKRTF